ncbi:portal protein [Streptomyces phage Galactica]|nr:portal protein [Streptomyces phage Galactica]
MPLPDNNPAWPPAECKQADRHYREWGAWYSGDPDELRKFYQVSNGFGALIDPKQYPNSASNLLNQSSRFFWGNPPDAGSLRDAKLHIPLAGDIASTSADLLFGEPPAFTVVEDLDGSDRTQSRLDKIVENGLIPALLEAAETDSALGGVYLRVVADAELGTPTFDVIPPESAVPEWRGNRLKAVTFWRELEDDQGKVYRHLERHEPGWIYHALYVGTEDRLGVVVDLRLRPETEGFYAQVGDAGRAQTGTELLTAEYIPNMRPNRLMRGSPLGRSDYSGVEPTMDALDEAWSSLMRDIRLGKSRLVVPESYLESNGPGRGARFNAERELFTPVKAMPDNEGVSLEQVQFDIRIDEHLTACKALAVQALRGAGYAAQTFGEGDQGGPVTATEVQARERRSYTTRDRKIGYWRPPLARLSRAALEMDKFWFRSDAGDTSEPPNLEWPDGVQVDMETTSKIVQMLDAAKAVSLRTKVQMVHPQWDKEQVQEEMDQIEGDDEVEVDADENADQGDEPEFGDPPDPELDAVNEQALERVGAD